MTFVRARADITKQAQIRAITSGIFTILKNTDPCNDFHAKSPNIEEV